MARPGRAWAAVLLAALAAFAPACSRPPTGMRRLDSGDANHWFRLDQDKRRLFYIEGDGDLIASRLGVADLQTGDRKSYRFSPEHIVALRPSPDGNSVAVAVENDDESEDGDYQLLKVNAATGRVLFRKASDSISEKDFAAFGDASPGSAVIEAQPASGLHPGVKTAVRRDGRRSVRLFPTPTQPENVILASDDEVYASYPTTSGNWEIERLDPAKGTRRIIASFPGRVESMAYVGSGLAVLRRREGDSGPRLLAMVDAAGAGVELELPWSNGDSEILGADTAKRLLYVRMDEGESRTCWAVHFDEKALRAASAYLTAARAPNVPKLTGTDVVGLVVVMGVLVVMFALLAASGS